MNYSLLLLLPALLLAGCRESISIYPVVVQGRATEIRFPEPWIEQTSGDVKTLLPPNLYEIRRPADATSNMLLFAGMSAVGYGRESEYPGKKAGDVLYSENIYSIDLDKNFEVRAATSEEWQSAHRVSEDARSDKFPDADKETFDHNGINIQRPGEHWGLVGLSPAGNLLAVSSYSGKQTGGGLFPFLGGGIKNGDVYWDVYDAKSGAKIVSWYAKSVQTPGVGSNAAWVEDRYLVMPLEFGSNNFVIADLLP